jgi:hypothetical protein
VENAPAHRNCLDEAGEGSISPPLPLVITRAWDCLNPRALSGLLAYLTHIPEPEGEEHHKRPLALSYPANGSEATPTQKALQHYRL